MSTSLREFCLQYGREEILGQWHPGKNEGCDADSLSYGSHRKVWWKCGRGHEWESAVYARTGGQGCPYCTGKKVWPGEDLLSLFPDIGAQWHPEKNAPMTPDRYLPGSHKAAWWQCGQGHTWKASIKSRTEGRGCPVCAGRVIVIGENDLAACFPDLAEQWHPTKNGALKPTQVNPGSDRRIWWQCPRGHEWLAPVSSRTAGKGCPVCGGRTVLPGENDLQSYDPMLARQWCRERNGTLTPEQVSPGSKKAVWWRCDLGHEWKSVIASRTFNKSGCPYCSGRKVLPGFNDLATVEPRVAAQWHPDRNAPLEPTMVTIGSTKKVWWKCQFGHEWKTVVYSRAGVQKCGCPVCAGKRK